MPWAPQTSLPKQLKDEVELFSHVPDEAQSQGQGTGRVAVQSVGIALVDVVEQR